VKKLLARVYSNKFGTKQHQNHQSLLKHIFRVLFETQHVFVFVTNVTLA